MKKENIQSEIASCDTESAFKTQFKISAVFRLPIIQTLFVSALVYNQYLIDRLVDWQKIM